MGEAIVKVKVYRSRGRQLDLLVDTGYTTLEILGFRVNPITQKLEKVRPFEYKTVIFHSVH